MRIVLFSTLFLCVTLLSSCTLLFNVYIRNTTKNQVIVDVSLLRANEWKMLPNSVKTADRIIEFRGNYRKFFETTEYVDWVSPMHFQMKLNSNSTLDLSDMAGNFFNGYPKKNVRVVILSQNKSDTLINGRNDFRRDRFLYKSRVSKPILYYDIK